MRAVLCGYYGMGNGGDEALLATLLQMLPDRVEPIALSGNPAETSKRYGIEACNRKSFPAVFRALQTSELFIWGGGSLMQDATSLFSPLYYAGLMALAQTMGLRTIAWGQGIGPLKRSITRWMTRRVLKNCVAVSVRDRASAELLSGWNIPFTLAPDPVWALESEPVPNLWSLPAPRVAIALRHHPHLTPERIERLTRALVSFQTATQTCILLLPFQPAQDMAIAQAIQPHLPGANTILTLEEPQQLKGVFHGVEMTIAMRLHALIMAAGAECRCFALSYDPKVSQLMQETQMPGWAIEEIPDDPNEICRIWLDHYANGDGMMRDQVSAVVDRALLHRDLLHDVI